MKKVRKALVVLSGGQDSTTCLYWARHQGYQEVHAITFNYSQRHALEIRSACLIAKIALCDSHEVIEVPKCLVSTSPLTSSAELERYEDATQMEEVIGDRVELTFVPMRNTLFLTIAANRAIALGCTDIITGICQEDNANYPDCREQYRQSMEDAINESLGMQMLKIVAPLMYCSKAETVNMALKLPGCMDALAYSHTSYDGKYPPTDMNHANVLRAKGFEDAGIPDPLVLRAIREGVMEIPSTENYDSVR